MFSRISRRWPASVGALGLASLLPLTSGCAYNATASVPRQTLIFEYSVEGPELAQANNLAYYFVIDTDGNPETGPLVNGAAPLTHPYPDPRSYIPFVRDERDVLDRQPVSVPNTVWSDYFVMFQDAGQMVMWQGRRNADGTINERVRQLQNGREWGIKDGRTVQITIPFDQLSFQQTADGSEPPPPPAQFECNLAVATRAFSTDQRGFLIERWGRVQNIFFPVQTRDINQNLYDTVSGVTFPENLGGLDPRSVNLTAITYRVVTTI